MHNNLVNKFQLENIKITTNLLLYDTSIYKIYIVNFHKKNSI